jgi:hypothetical protein
MNGFWLALLHGINGLDLKNIPDVSMAVLSIAGDESLCCISDIWATYSSYFARFDKQSLLM